MCAVYQHIEILMYQLIMSVVTDIDISCTSVYCCVSQILTYQLIMSVVTDISVSAAHQRLNMSARYQCIS